MKSKKILILALIISSTVGLLGCFNSSSKEISLKENSLAENNTSDKDNNSAEIKKTEESISNASKPATTSSENKNTDTNKNNNANTNTGAKKQEEDTSLNYKSKLGFSLTFPTNWKNRYTVKEDNNSMYVYFKSSDPNTPKNLGLLFFIKKNYTQDDENMSDSVLPNGRRHITVGNTTYLVGGPTDVNLNEDNKDFQIFLSIKKELEQVINTIKP